MPRNTYAKVRLDTLLFALGGFAECEPTRVEKRNARMVRLWSKGLTGQEIADQLGVARVTVYFYAHALQLPARRRCPRREAMTDDSIGRRSYQEA